MFCKINVRRMPWSLCLLLSSQEVINQVADVGPVGGCLGSIAKQEGSQRPSNDWWLDVHQSAVMVQTGAGDGGSGAVAATSTATAHNTTTASTAMLQ